MKREGVVVAAEAMRTVNESGKGGTFLGERVLRRVMALAWIAFGILLVHDFCFSNYVAYHMPIGRAPGPTTFSSLYIPDWIGWMSLGFAVAVTALFYWGRAIARRSQRKDRS